MRDADHPVREAIDRFLTDFASDLQSDTDTSARVERLKTEILERPEVQDLIAPAWTAVTRMMLDAAEDERANCGCGCATSLLRSAAPRRRIRSCRDKVDGWVEGAAVYVVADYPSEITSLITDTVAGWDAEHTTKKIELQVGRDLQFIRINGTVVGSLAGLLIYTVSELII